MYIVYVYKIKRNSSQETNAYIQIILKYKYHMLYYMNIIFILFILFQDST